MSGVAGRKILRYRGSVAAVSCSEWAFFDISAGVKRVTPFLAPNSKLAAGCCPCL